MVPVRSWSVSPDRSAKLAQARYYAVLWPGIALAATSGVGVLARRSHLLAAGAVLLLLIPTVPGGMALELLLR